MGYSTSEDSILEAVNVTFVVISMIASLFIIISYVLFPNLRKVANSFIFYIAIADLIRSFAKSWGSLSHGTFFCSLQGYLMTFGGLSSFLWVSCIAILIYCLIFYPMQTADILKKEPTFSNVINSNNINNSSSSNNNKNKSVKSKTSEDDGDSYSISYYYNDDSRKCNTLCKTLFQFKKDSLSFKLHLIIWPFSLLLSIIPLITNSYGNVGGWCWIIHGNTNLDHAWRWVCFYGWLILSILLSIFIYIRCFFHLMKLNSNVPEKNRGAQQKMMERIRFYPLALIIAFSFSTYRRIDQIFNDESPFGIAICQAIFAGSYGLLNAIVYGVHPSVIHSYSVYFRALFCSQNERRGGVLVATPRANNQNNDKTINESDHQQVAHV